MRAAAAPSSAEPLGLPRGSVRALLALMIVGLFCGLIIIRGVVERSPELPGGAPGPDPAGPVVPPTLLYLLFIVLCSYFARRESSEEALAEERATTTTEQRAIAAAGAVDAALGAAKAVRDAVDKAKAASGRQLAGISEAAAKLPDPGEAVARPRPRRPLFLPRGSIRALLLLGCVGGAAVALENGLAEDPAVLAVLILLGTFFAGVLLRSVKLTVLTRGGEKSGLLVGIEHAKAVICLLMTATLGLLYLFSQDEKLGESMQLLLGIPVVFYFGSR